MYHTYKENELELELSNSEVGRAEHRREKKRQKQHLHQLFYYKFLFAIFSFSLASVMITHRSISNLSPILVKVTSVNGEYKYDEATTTLKSTLTSVSSTSTSVTEDILTNAKPNADTNKVSLAKNQAKRILQLALGLVLILVLVTITIIKYHMY
jgi:hypothetical protein